MTDWGWAKRAACQNVEDDGWLMPVLFCQGREGNAVLGMEWPDRDSKYKVLPITVAHARQLSPIALCLIVDAYVRKAAPGEAGIEISGSLAEDPLASEGLIVMAVDADGVVCETREYGRDDSGGIQWGEWTDLSGRGEGDVAESWIVELLQAAVR